MTPARCLARFFVAVLVLLPFSPATAAEMPPRLAKPPLGERWFSISKGEEKTGFNRLEIRESGDGYEVLSDSDTKMTVLGFAREARTTERYQVNRDLSLKSFAAEVVINGKPMKLKGEATAKEVRLTVEADGSTREKTLKVKGAVYPPPVLNIYPLMQGVDAGKSFRLKMLDVEEVKIKEVKISVLGTETQADGTVTVHEQNDLYPFVDNDIWVDFAGNTVREFVRRAKIITQAVDGETGRKLLATRPWLKNK